MTKANSLSNKSGRYLKDDDKHINIADVIDRGTNFFNEFKVAQNVTQFALNNNLPLSSLRDIQVGNVSKQGSEYRVRADTDDNTSILRTALRGNYQSGTVMNPGMGIRIPTLPTGDQYAEWGYYEYDGNNDPDNGISCKRTANDFTINVYKNGTNQLGSNGVSQADWNIDPMDGTGPSGVNISVPNGYVFNTPFIYYGYGPIYVFIGVTDKEGTRRMFPVHVAELDEGTSMEEPNLPLTVTAYNGGDTSTFDVFVGGRQVSVSGSDVTVRPRVVGAEVRGKSISNTLTPIISFRHKTGRENIRVTLGDIWVESDVDMHLYLYRNGALSGPNTTYSTPFGYTATETATEWNGNAPTTNGATGISGASRFGGNRYVAVGELGNSSSISSAELPRSVLIEGEAWTLVGQTRSGTATVNAGVNIFEEW